MSTPPSRPASSLKIPDTPSTPCLPSAPPPTPATTSPQKDRQPASTPAIDFVSFASMELDTYDDTIIPGSPTKRVIQIEVQIQIQAQITSSQEIRRDWPQRELEPERERERHSATKEHRSANKDRYEYEPIKDHWVEDREGRSHQNSPTKRSKYYPENSPPPRRSRHRDRESHSSSLSPMKPESIKDRWIKYCEKRGKELLREGERSPVKRINYFPESDFIDLVYHSSSPSPTKRRAFDGYSYSSSPTKRNYTSSESPTKRYVHDHARSKHRVHASRTKQDSVDPPAAAGEKIYELLEDSETERRREREKKKREEEKKEEVKKSKAARASRFGVRDPQMMGAAEEKDMIFRPADQGPPGPDPGLLVDSDTTRLAKEDLIVSVPMATAITTVIWRTAGSKTTNGAATDGLRLSESIEDHGVEDYEARLFEKLQKAIKKVNVLSDLWLSHKSTRDQSSKHYPKIAHLPGCDHYHGRAKSPGEHEDRWTEAHCEGGDHSDRDEYARDPPAKRRNVVAERDSRNGVYQSLSRSPVKRYSNDAKDDEDFCSPPPAKRRKFSERDSVSCNDDSSRGRSLSSANRRDYAAVSRSPAKRHTQDEDDSACSSAPARHIQHSSETREDCPIHNHRVNAGQTRRDGGGDPTPARKRVRPGYWYRKVAVGLTSESGEDD
ncbi:hypothetical protein EDC01DRAFT_788157 [Geopyxis carbonaria]|nr:hypothetical protein EDC01DRAFT_788157 [Geopyxis carbonaria]